MSVRLRGKSTVERSISEIRKLAARFAESSDSPVDADKAERVLRAGHGCEFATAMFAQFRDTHEPWEYAELQELMTRVEQIVDQTPFLGAYLFARLYPVAARHRAHTICNAIELWFAQAPIPGAGEALGILSEESIRPRFKKRIADWGSRLV